MSDAHTFYGIFTYEGVRPNPKIPGSHVFLSCTLLKDVGETKKGSTMEEIYIQATLQMWDDNDEHVQEDLLVWDYEFVCWI